MQQISSITSSIRFERANNNRTSERSELIRFFHENLRDKTGKPFRVQFIAVKLSHLSVQDLYFLKQICEQSACFGATFWGSIKSNLKILPKEKNEKRI